MSTITTSKQRNALPWAMWACACLFYCYENILQVSPGVMLDDWMLSFGLTASTSGTLVAFFMYTYASVQIPAGMMVDRWGARRLLTFAATVVGAGCFFIACAHDFFLAATGRALIGLGAGFAAISCLHIASTSLPLERFAMLTGFTLTIGMLGSFIGEKPLALLLTHIPWRQTLSLMGLAGLVLAILIWLIVKDKKMPGDRTDHARSTFFTGIKEVMSCKQSWLIAGYAGLMFAPIPTLSSIWGVPFLQAKFHIPKETAASMISFIFIGFAVGAPIFGWFSDTIGRRKPPLLIASLGALLSLSALVYDPNISHTTAYALLFLFGFFTSGFLPSFSMIRENNLPQNNATCLGFMNTLNMTGGALFQPLGGIILDQFWTGRLADTGIRVYSIDNYHTALLVLPAGIALSLLFLPFMKETHNQQREN